MRSSRVGLFVALVVATSAGASFVGACSSSNAPAGSSSGTTGDAFVEPREASVNDAAREGATDVDAGPVVPDTACGVAGGTRATLNAGGTAPLFDALGTVGARRVAQGAGDEGFVLLDVSGANASAAPVVLGLDLNHIATGGSVLGVVGVTLPDIFFQRYDATGAVVGGGPALQLGSDPSSEVFVGQSAGAFLTVWSDTQGVTARGVDAAGALAGPAFALDAAKQENFTASVVSSGSSFAVLWVGYTFTSPGHTLIRTVFATASTTAAIATHDISANDQARTVVQLVKTPTGYAALVDDPGGPPDNTGRTRLLLLDANGNVTNAPSPFLAGAVRGLGLAAQGGELGVVVERTAQTVGFRPFDANAAPLGPWVCLGSTAPSMNSAAIDADGAGYAVTFGSGANHAASLARFNRLGN